MLEVVLRDGRIARVADAASLTVWRGFWKAKTHAGISRGLQNPSVRCAGGHEKTVQRALESSKNNMLVLIKERRL
jgi:hypothetical protein